MRTIRGGKGIGDALYVQAVARHLVRLGEKLMVLTAWPEVYSQLAVETGPFSRSADIIAHYTMRKHRDGTDQFQDCCLQAGIREPVELRLDWTPRTDVGKRLRDEARGRPIVLLELMRTPMNRTDKFGATLLPRGEVMQRIVDRIRERVFLVQIGSGRSLYPLRGFHLDLSNKTTVPELLEAGQACDGLLGYVSFFVPLAESFGKRALFLWSKAGLKDRHLYVRQITPHKIIHRKDLCHWVMDDCDVDAAADAFLG